jgi:glycerol-3-phosphate O-acyltransferase
MVKQRPKNIEIYPPVIPEIEDWPIFKLSEDREAFIKEINKYTLEKIIQKQPELVSDLLIKTIYLERIRIKEEPWKVDPPNERQFWNKIRKNLVRFSLDKEEEEAKASNEEILKKIIGRYAEEIVGTFQISTFLFARKFLNVFFNRLLNTAASRNFRRFYGRRHHLADRLEVLGETDSIRSLMTKGTVIVVPTHFSNLDSILIGYAMDSILGLPSFSYGAGLNLYNTGYTAYFMNRLGAYRVDRRKKNGIYLETLKAMSTLSIKRGTNSLFFPGGTRSRSGAIESKLKMGLMGTAVEAQRMLCEEGKKEKVFIVPLVLGYHVVLEAKFLIEQHLKETGKEHFLQIKDASYSRWKILRFMWKLFSQGSHITLSFGKPMDVVGNFVNEEGKSFDKWGNPIDVKDYFLTNGEVKANPQRETEYTKILADKIAERFHKDNIVLSSHLVAFATFNILLNENIDLDLYGILRLPCEDYVFEIEQVSEVIEALKTRLIEIEKKGDIKLSKIIHFDTIDLIKHGVKNVGNFHPLNPLKFNKEGNLVSEDFNTLYYYHNRLENYNLHKVISKVVAQAKINNIS